MTIDQETCLSRNTEKPAKTVSPKKSKKRNKYNQSKELQRFVIFITSVSISYLYTLTSLNIDWLRIDSGQALIFNWILN